jgi:3'-phosphoadenosine 5'-phosphosulfate (PAPS) 3'-phosphatase
LRATTDEAATEDEDEADEEMIDHADHHEHKTVKKVLLSARTALEVVAEDEAEEADDLTEKENSTENLVTQEHPTRVVMSKKAQEQVTGAQLKTN